MQEIFLKQLAKVSISVGQCASTPRTVADSRREGQVEGRDFGTLRERGHSWDFQEVT